MDVVKVWSKSIRYSVSKPGVSFALNGPSPSSGPGPAALFCHLVFGLSRSRLDAENKMSVSPAGLVFFSVCFKESISPVELRGAST